MKILRTLAAGLFITTLGCSSLVQAGYSKLYVFGDSLSDPGNMYNSVYAGTGGTVQFPPPPYYQGRASNGPVAVEYLADRLGLSAKRVIDTSGAIDPTGTNFSFIGAATGPVDQVYSPPASYNNYAAFRYGTPDLGLVEELGIFNGMTGGAADPAALYFLWAGPNDAYIALEDPAIDPNDAVQMNTVATTTAIQAATRIGGYIQYLATLGAQKFLAVNLPDLGRTPDALATSGTAYAPALTLFSDTFNATLHSTIASLELAIPSIDIVEFNMAAVFDRLMASGVYNTTTPCLDPGVGVCADPDTHLFWDGVHPTTAVDQQVADLMASAVPEPLPLWMMFTGLLALGLYRVRRT